MKLNSDCVRELLLLAEKSVDYDHEMRVNKVQLNGFTIEEILYTADKLHEAGFISGIKKSGPLSSQCPYITIQSITWEGHKFLDNIRDNVVWKKTKSVLSKFSSVSLEIISSVASKIIVEMININGSL